MLQIIFIWWIIGWVLLSIFCGKSILNDIANGKVFIAITGTVVLSFVAPIYFITGIIAAILSLLNKKHD